jgi:hypothetical protein
VDCWAKGGGKEGQGPWSKSKKDKKEPKKETASAVVEEGVWMAIASNSGNKHMANDEFDNFTISENDLFSFEEENNENKIQELTSRLKEQLKINDLLKHIYPYNDLVFMLNPQNFTDSSNDNDNAGAAAMTMESESENEVEVDPYWTKVKVDELQNLGNPMQVLFSDTDSMPGLETILESEDSVFSC